jgi:anti-anti-sigma regulatory factor
MLFMSPGFSISLKPRSESLYVQIQGGFDGSSAQQLLYRLRQYVGQFPMIIIDTDCVSHTDVFGLNVFRYNLEAMQTASRHFSLIEFTGNMAAIFQAAISNQHHLTGGESHACEELDERTRHYDR